MNDKKYEIKSGVPIPTGTGTRNGIGGKVSYKLGCRRFKVPGTDVVILIERSGNDQEDGVVRVSFESFNSQYLFPHHEKSKAVIAKLGFTTEPEPEPESLIEGDLEEIHIGEDGA